MGGTGEGTGMGKGRGKRGTRGGTWGTGAEHKIMCVGVFGRGKEMVGGSGGWVSVRHLCLGSVRHLGLTATFMPQTWMSGRRKGRAWVGGGGKRVNEGGGWRMLVSRARAERGGGRGGGVPRGGWGTAMGGRRMLGTLLRVAGGVGVMGLLGGVAYVYEVRRKSDAYRVLWQEKKDEIEYQVCVCVCVCIRI
jgi:hypothetical protein